MLRNNPTGHRGGWTRQGLGAVWDGWDMNPPFGGLSRHLGRFNPCTHFPPGPRQDFGEEDKGNG
jgi:hypothetical protein